MRRAATQLLKKLPDNVVFKDEGDDEGDTPRLISPAHEVICANGTYDLYRGYEVVKQEATEQEAIKWLTS